MAKNNKYILYDHIWKKNVLENVSMADIAAHCKMSAQSCYGYHKDGKLIKNRYEIQKYIPRTEEDGEIKKKKPVKFYRTGACSGYYPRQW